MILQAADLVRRCRRRISRYFCERPASNNSDLRSLNSRLQELGQQLSLNEKVGLLGRQMVDNMDDAGLNEQADDHIEGDTSIDLHGIRDFIILGRPFRQLAERMRQTFYLDDQLTMTGIQEKVVQALLFNTHPQHLFSSVQAGIDNKASSHYLVIEMDWKPLAFVKAQFDDRTCHLSSMVTLSGSAFYAYAATVAEYMEKTWPSSGTKLLKSLQALIDPRTKTIERQKRVGLSGESIFGSY